ncbi:MAG: (2Fe-2S)-binding protein [Deltaproteobacteria bacterium]|nr:(2Fe-2S)-binding protein [Deltaproteobacteria bacterium]
MADRTVLPFRLIRAGLRAASRVGAGVADRVARTGVATHPAVVSPRAVATVRAPVQVRFGDREVTVERGRTLLEAAREHDIDLRSYCGGNCSCGTCRVEIVGRPEGLSRRESMEEFVLGMDATRRGDRLACQAEVIGPVDVRVPDWF